mmetsp:Transcript_101460/g.287487  ORF Transcript_101460/g.287487 Transcript_101460/m.287487 type:complete len:394 (+) Transcript_101460:94-1275(+)
MLAETFPILRSIGARVSESYSTSPHATFEELEKGADPVVIDYNPLKLSSYRVFTACKGTILLDSILLTEQVLISFVFVVAAAPPYVFFNEKYGEDRNGPMTVRRWLAEQEGNMRAFAQIMTMLAAFLLSFYTSMAVGRWWTIRTSGVGGIKASAVELELLIYQLCTQEEQVLSAIRRYARASLTLVFLWRRNQLDSLHLLVERGLLTEDEVSRLKTWNHNLHESIWAWQTGIVTALFKEGKVKSDQLLNLLLDRCTAGRAAAQLIHTYLAVKIPMQYIHLLGLLVKLHNTVLAFIMGMLFGAAVRDGKTIICIQLFGRTLLLPLLFNAILLINAELADPFNGGVTDFPALKYEETLEKDIHAFKAATENAPEWLHSRIFPAVSRRDELPRKPR